MLFKKRNDNVKRCSEGHIMDPSWDTCPYCEDDESSRVVEPGMGTPSGTGTGIGGASDPAYPTPAPPMPPAPTSQPLSPPPPPTSQARPMSPPAPPATTAPTPGPMSDNDDFEDLTVVGYQPAAPAPPQPAPPITPQPVQPAPPLTQQPVQPAPPPPEQLTTQQPAPPQASDTKSTFGMYLAWIIVVSGDYKGRDFRLTPGAVIVGTGRECGIRLAGEPFISGRHAEFTLLGKQCHFRDLNSTNGSFVNGDKVNEVSLTDGDQVRLGNTRFLFKCMSI